MIARRFLAMTALLVTGLAVLAGAVFSAMSMGSERPLIDQERYHLIGTRSREADFSASVERRPVIVDAPSASVGAIAAGYLDRIRRGEPLGGVQGEYDPQRRRIRIVGDEVRLQSRLPQVFRAELHQVVRHEYGHAAFFDRLSTLGLSHDHAAAVALHRRRDPLPEAMPAELVGVVAEWRDGPDDVYADPYLTSNLAEYLAESYARVLAGRPVPPHAESYIRSYARR